VTNTPDESSKNTSRRRKGTKTSHGSDPMTSVRLKRSRVVSRAKTYLEQGKDVESRAELEALFGGTSSGLLTFFDRATSCWKMWLPSSGRITLGPSLLHLGSAGLMRSGLLFVRATSPFRTGGNGSSSSPIPTASAAGNGKGNGGSTACSPSKSPSPTHVRPANWPTPLASDAMKSGFKPQHHRKGKRGNSGIHQMCAVESLEKIQNWPTPLASDSHHAHFTTEQIATDVKRKRKRKPGAKFRLPDGAYSHVTEVSAVEFGLRPTPLLSLWLMGFPRDWLDGIFAPKKPNGKPAATRSSRRSRNGSRDVFSTSIRESRSPDENTDMSPELTIDSEFRSLIPPLSEEEFALLRQQVLDKGCLEPLYVWNDGDDRSILLDGHNRHQICSENGVAFAVVEVPNLASREEAKLWILEHQAGRRNLNDDQRAVVWNDIREARSRLTVAEKMRKARETKAVGPMSAESTDIEPDKTDTRKEIAAEAKLPESKLRQAQALKKADPGLYEKVRSGESSIRAARKSLGTGRPGVGSAMDRDGFRDIRRALNGLFKGALKRRLDDFAGTSRGEMTPAQKRGLQKIAAILDDLSESSDRYAAKFRAILRSAKRAS
jgi:hypothetical protein